MRIALYARVSMDEKYEDKRFQDPENQLVPLREWAKNNNWNIVAEFVDRASGADAGRINFRRMREAARVHKFDCILIWKMDRFSRENLSTVHSYVSELRRNNVGIKSYTESWLDTTQDSPVGELILSFMAWAASEERRKISERTKAGIARRRAIGQWRGGRPRKKGGLVVEPRKVEPKERGV